MQILAIRCVTKSLSPDYHARWELFKAFDFFFTKEFFSYVRWKILAFYLFKLTNRKTEITINFSRENSDLRCNILWNKFSLAVGISPLLLSRVAFGRLSTVQICIYSNACAIGYTHTLGKNFECRLFSPSTSLAATKPPYCPSFLFLSNFRPVSILEHFAVFCIFFERPDFSILFQRELQSFFLRVDYISSNFVEMYCLNKKRDY